MFGLVFRSDLLTLLVFWDLLGFTSFFLVVYYRSRGSLTGGLLTGLTNRVGDCLLLFWLGLGLVSGHSLSFGALVLLVLASFTKSAQVPFSAWLPSAMVAPTPVSALVHSSTLVTAGVYLLYRFVALPSLYVLGIGGFTILVAGLSACFSTDIKKIIALSTLSQLGIIVVSLGIGERSLCFGHLITHAYFKALLFIVVGSVIHTIYSGQERRCSGFIASGSPFLIVCAVTSVFSMVGLFFLAGFVSKEAILVSYYNALVPVILLFIFYLGIFLTGVYSFRLLSAIITSNVTSVRNILFSPCSRVVALPTSVLLFFAVRMGYVLVIGKCLVFSVLRLNDMLLLLIILRRSLFTANAGVAPNSNNDVLLGLFASTSALSALAPSMSTIGKTETVEVLALHSSTLKSTLAFSRVELGLCSRLIVSLFIVIFLI